MECVDKDPRAISAGSDTALDGISIFSGLPLVTLRQPEFEATERQLTWYQRYGGRLLLPSHPEYPQALCRIPDPPPFRFVRDSLTGNSRPIVA